MAVLGGEEGGTLVLTRLNPAYELAMVEAGKVQACQEWLDFLRTPGVHTSRHLYVCTVVPAGVPELAHMLGLMRVRLQAQANIR